LGPTLLVGCGPQVLQQPPERVLVRIVIFPIAEIRDVDFADLAGRVLPYIRIKAFLAPDDPEI
jgi:hypothetical protein